MRRCVLLFALLIFCAGSTSAQRLDPTVASVSAAASRLGITRQGVFDTARVPQSVPLRIVARTGMGALGWGVGAAGGVLAGVAGAAFLPTCSGCEDPGFGYVLLGGAAGGALGAAVLAAEPALGDGCRHRSRFAGALGTAVLAGGLNFGVAYAARSEGLLATVPLVTVGAAVAGTFRCRATAQPADPGDDPAP